MAKTSRTYRLPDDTINKVDSLGDLFGETQAEVITRAIDLLDREKAAELKREYEIRINRATGKD